MIEHYQPFSLPFFGSHAASTHPLIKRYYYWSWEDGLWDLLTAKHISKGSVILLPDFYCSDVIENIRSHGYTVAFYRVNQHFQVKKQTLLNSIRRYKPKVVVIFHACGIQNTIIGRSSMIQEITKKAVLIEDAVHLLLNPSSVRPLNERHFIMDSLRKVSPFYGSYLYGTKKGMAFHQTKTSMSFIYLYAAFLYVAFRAILKLSYLFHSAKLASFAHKTLLYKHDIIIGDNLSHRGNKIVALFSQWINFEKIERTKKEQVQWYEKAMKPLYTRSTLFYKVKMKRSDYGKLHVYPVGLKQKVDKTFLSFLQENGIVVWTKFSDSAWAKKRDVLFLPLGFHVEKDHIKMIVKTLTAWKTGAWKSMRVEEQITSPHLLVRAAQFILSF